MVKACFDGIALPEFTGWFPANGCWTSPIVTQGVVNSITEDTWDKSTLPGSGVGVRDLGLYSSGVLTVCPITLISWSGEGVELPEGGVAVAQRTGPPLPGWAGI